MNANLVTTWTPILKALPEGERERTRELIEKYGETHPTSFIVELLHLFGIHAAYLQTVPEQVVAAGEETKRQIESSVDLATKLHERTRLELNTIISSITRTGEGFTKAVETAATAQMRAIENGNVVVKKKIEQEFEKQNLPALTARLTAVQEQSERAEIEAGRLQKETERIQKVAEDRLLSAERRCELSATKIEELNWRGAWIVCSLLSFALFLVAGVCMYEFLRSRSDAILADKIAAATATIKQNRDAFEQLAIGNIALTVNRSTDAKTGNPVPSGFAIIVENAQVAEMRDYGNGKAGFVFANGSTSEDEIHRLQVTTEKLTQKSRPADAGK